MSKFKVIKYCVDVVRKYISVEKVKKKGKFKILDFLIIYFFFVKCSIVFENYVDLELY